MNLVIPKDGSDLSLQMEMTEGVHALGAGIADILAAIDIRAGEKVLDLGCGCGIYGLYAAAAGCAEAVLTDICPDAVETSRSNGVLNGLDNLRFMVGDFFDPVAGETFDSIFANVPQTPAPEPMRADKWGGPDGHRHLLRLAAEAPGHLNAGGRLFFLLIGLARPRQVLAKMEEHFALECVYRRERPFALDEYEGYQKGLSDYLIRQRNAGHAEFEKSGDSWTFESRMYCGTLKNHPCKTEA